MRKISIFIIGILIGILVGFILSNVNWHYFYGPTCLDGTKPDIHGCCTDEEYTDMGDQGFNCCPPGDGDCFPPIK